MEAERRGDSAPKHNYLLLPPAGAERSHRGRAPAPICVLLQRSGVKLDSEQLI